MKLTVHTTKKIGLRGYGSQCYGATLEIELQEGTPEEVARTYRAAAADLRRLVEAEIARDRDSEAAPARGHNENGSGNGRPAKGHNGNGHSHGNSRSAHHNGNGNDRGPCTLSAKQKNFLLGLSSKRGWRIPQLNDELRVILDRADVSLHSLTKQEASLAIESLKADQQ